MSLLQPHFATLLNSLPPSPIEQAKLDKLIGHMLEETASKSSQENRKSQWEYLLKNNIFELAEQEGLALKEDPAKYYNDLCEKLDVILTFTEHDACEQTVPLSIIQELLETQTVASCSHIFSWIEARASRLTDGMVPQKGKALILLRTLNDLLRRLSKTGSTTIFCGRILTFLSGVFPLGERSGVNLRGEYGPTWEGVRYSSNGKGDQSDETMKVDVQEEAVDSVADSDKMQVDLKDLKPPATQSTAEKKEDFYNTFWSLQLPFSKPPLFAEKETFPTFKEAVIKVLPVIKEATAKERAMMGSRGVGNAGTLKRKREPDEESNLSEYFFAKFLTSPDLLDLEIADTHFRRQFLFQLLILLNHLLDFTKTAKAAWFSNRNRSLQTEFTLEDADAQWVQEMLLKVTEELRQTTPNGRIFADTVSAILERERNWVKWKNELCTPFDMEPWAEEIEGQKVGLFEATKRVRDQTGIPPEDWNWRFGTEALTEIWDMGYSSLQDLQNPFQAGEVKDFVKKIKQEDARIAMRKQRLEKMSALMKARGTTTATITNPTPIIVVSSETGQVNKVESLVNSSEPTLEALAAPMPVIGLGNSPLHPSLPPKPGSPAKPAPVQEPVRSTPPVPVPATPSVPVTAPLPVDEEIAKYEENKHRWAWLALRAGRDQYLQLFGKIGTGDIEVLAQEIESSKDNGGGSAEEQRSGSPSITTESLDYSQRDGEADVKMDG